MRRKQRIFSINSNITSVTEVCTSSTDKYQYKFKISRSAASITSAVQYLRTLVPPGDVLVLNQATNKGCLSEKNE